MTVYKGLAAEFALRGVEEVRRFQEELDCRPPELIAAAAALGGCELNRPSLSMERADRFNMGEVWGEMAVIRALDLGGQPQVEPQSS